MIRGAAASATRPSAASAASAALEAGGSAVDAIVAGFFAAAGESPGVLLAPALALVGGAGVGSRAFDGRSAQPGRGAERPRGFVAAGDIPNAARVGVPRAVVMLTHLHGYRGRLSLRELARGGASEAEKAGAKSRAEMLRAVGATGVLAMRSGAVASALVAAAGAVAGGTLTSTDLDEVVPAEQEATLAALEGETGLILPPWPTSVTIEPPKPGKASEGMPRRPPPRTTVGSGGPLAETTVLRGYPPVSLIVAVDARGIAAALAYAATTDGVPVPELELLAPLVAAPVRRGVTRVPPGTLLPSVAPIAIVIRKGGFLAALGLPERVAIDPAGLSAIATGALLEAVLDELRAEGNDRTAIAAVTDGKLARSIVRSGAGASSVRSEQS